VCVLLVGNQENDHGGGDGAANNDADVQQPLSPAPSDTGSDDAATEVYDPEDYHHALLDEWDGNMSDTASSAETVTHDLSDADDDFEL